MSSQTIAPVFRKNYAIADRRFYLAMAIASVVLVFAGFGRSYYLRAAFSVAPRYSPSLYALLHVHGFVFSLWMLYFLLQTSLIAVRKPKLHRNLGIFGVTLAGAMVVVGLAVAIVGMRLGHGGIGQDAETILLVGLVDLLVFTSFFLAGWIKRRDRESHQRLMLLAVVIGLSGPAFGRFVAQGVPLPVVSLLNLSLIFAGPIYDFATRRRIHPVYLTGVFIGLITFTPLRFLVGHTSAWHRIAHVISGT